MLRSSLHGVVLIGVVAFLFSFFAPSDASALSCTLQVRSCTKQAAKFSKSLASTIAQCREVRECRQECRTVKRAAAQVCRGGKAECVSACRAKFGRGRDFRGCRRGCRREKRSCKSEARADKRECRSVCRATFLTPECRRARLKVVGSSLRSTVACAALATCLKGVP